MAGTIEQMEKGIVAVVQHYVGTGAMLQQPFHSREIGIAGKFQQQDRQIDRCAIGQTT